MKLKLMLAAAAMAMVAACGAGDNPAQAADSEGGGAASTQTGAAAQAPLRGPELTALLGTDDKDICRPFTMDGRVMLYSHSFVSDGKGGYRAGAADMVPGLGKKVTPTLLQPAQNGGRYGARYDFEGRWHGLQVVGAGYDFKPSSGMAESTNLYFADSPEKVAAVLKKLGFPVADGGGAKVVRKDPGFGDADYFGLVSIIERRGDRTVFECREGPFDEGDY